MKYSKPTSKQCFLRNIQRQRESSQHKGKWVKVRSKLCIWHHTDSRGERQRRMAKKRNCLEGAVFKSIFIFSQLSQMRIFACLVIAVPFVSEDLCHQAWDVVSPSVLEYWLSAVPSLLPGSRRVGAPQSSNAFVFLFPLALHAVFCESLRLIFSFVIIPPLFSFSDFFFFSFHNYIFFSFSGFLTHLFHIQYCVYFCLFLFQSFLFCYYGCWVFFYLSDDLSCICGNVIFRLFYLFSFQIEFIYFSIG